MANKSEKYTARCDLGFCYEVTLEHRPQFGFSTIFYRTTIIGQVDLGERIFEPVSDNDAEWEAYEQRFAEWTDDVKTNASFICYHYFSNPNNRH